MGKQQLIKSQTNCRILNIKVFSTWFCWTHHLFSPLRRRSVGLTTDGHVYTWGHGYNYRLGHGTEANVTYPKRISTIKHKVIDIGVGSKHAVAVCDNGQVSRVMVLPPLIAGSKPTKISSGFFVLSLTKTLLPRQPWLSRIIAHSNWIIVYLTSHKKTEVQFFASCHSTPWVMQLILQLYEKIYSLPMILIFTGV